MTRGTPTSKSVLNLMVNLLYTLPEFSIRVTNWGFQHSLAVLHKVTHEAAFLCLLLINVAEISFSMKNAPFCFTGINQLVWMKQ